jgi:hypothetical protein
MTTARLEWRELLVRALPALELNAMLFEPVKTKYLRKKRHKMSRPNSSSNKNSSVRAIELQPRVAISHAVDFTGC